LVGRDRTTHSQRSASLVAIAVATFAAVPLLVCVPAPLQDWLGHLARVYVLDQLLRGIGPWQSFYDLNTFLIPNVALDLGILGLMRAGLSLGSAGAIFLVMTYALFITGFTRISRCFGAAHPGTPMLGALLFYNSALFWGLVNYLTGFGVLFWIVALWMGSRWLALRLLIAAMGAVATFACHLIPALLLVGVLGLLDLFALADDWPRKIPHHITSLAAAATVLGLLALSPAGEDDLLAVVYVGTESVQAFAYWKVALFAKALLGGAFWSDVVIGAGGGILLALVLITARIEFSGATLAILIAVTILPVLAPQRLGSGSLLDYRLAIVPFVFAAATARLRWRTIRGPALLFTTLAACVLVRSAVLAETWRGTSRTYAEADSAFATLPPGSVLLTVMGRSIKQIPWAQWWTPSVGHLDTLAVLHGIVVPTVFANRLQQPLALQTHAQEWSVIVDADTPARLSQVLTRSRLLCPDHPGVFIAALYPAPFMRGATVRAVNDRLSIIDVCATRPGPWIAQE
jgi:hypothetical protein